MNDIRQSFAQYGLVRPREARILGGVCAGLGQRFGFTPWTARLLFALLLMVIPGCQILVYRSCGSSCHQRRPPRPKRRKLRATAG